MTWGWASGELWFCTHAEMACCSDTPRIILEFQSLPAVSQCARHDVMKLLLAGP